MEGIALLLYCLKATCESWNGQSENGIRRMMGMLGIRVGTQGIKVGMQGIRVGMLGIGRMRGIRVRIWGMGVGILGIRLGMRGIRPGMRGMGVGMWAIGVGMRGIEWNRNRKKTKKKLIKSNFLFFLKLKKNESRIVIKC